MHFSRPLIEDFSGGLRITGIDDMGPVVTLDFEFIWCIQYIACCTLSPYAAPEFFFSIMSVCLSPTPLSSSLFCIFLTYITGSLTYRWSLWCLCWILILEFSAIFVLIWNMATFHIYHSYTHRSYWYLYSSTEFLFFQCILNLHIISLVDGCTVERKFYWSVYMFSFDVKITYLRKNDQIFTKILIYLP